MNAAETKIFNGILSDINFHDSEFSLEKLDHKTRFSSVYGFLTSIVNAVGCHDYLFILAVTKLEERYGDSSESILWEILDNYHLNPNAYDKQVAFAAFYNLAVHYYRTYETDNLRKLISDQLYYTTFYQDFPIINEAIARYCIITSMYDRQLVLARLTLQKFKEFAKLSEEERTLKSGYVQTFDNVALKVTFASALCSIFEHCFLKGQLGKPADGQSTSKITLDNTVPPEKLEEFIKREQSLSYNLSDIIPEYVALSHEYINDAIKYNPSYPKYYYFKARIIFFGTLFNGNKIDKDTYEQISNYLSTAKSKENSKASDYDVRCSIYDRFNSLVQDYYEDGASDAYDGGLYYQQKQMEIINMNVCPDHQNRPKITAGPGDKYAFISYSTQNFKRVYCDIYEMQRLGIQYWYDAETIPSEKWDEIVEEKIKNALCVICYLSVDFILSASILKELNFIRKYNKPIICIDLTGKKQISKIFADIMRNQPLSVVNTINSQKINAFMNAFDDDVDVISRNSDPASVYHVKRLEGVMVKKYAEAVRNVVTEGATWKNNKTFKNTAVIKPNEDYYVLNDANRIYTVVDGISRTEEDYLGPQPNSAHNVSKIFCEQFTQNLSSLLPWCNSVKVLQNYVKDAFIYANERVLDYLESIKESYKNKEIPGCVGIVSVIYNQRLVFGCFGDCMGILIRNGQKIVFGEKQTTYAFDYLKVEKDRKLLYKEYVNKPQNQYGYGVANGDKDAASMLKISNIALEYGDVVYLVSDGISDYIQFANADKINSMTLEELKLASDEQDVILNKAYSDDKTIIRIRVGA